MKNPTKTYCCHIGTCSTIFRFLLRYYTDHSKIDLCFYFCHHICVSGAGVLGYKYDSASTYDNTKAGSEEIDLAIICFEQNSPSYVHLLHHQ